MESLRSSQLKVETLDIFFNIPERLKCSLPCDNLSNSLITTTTGRLGPYFSTLKILSVSITDPMVDETKYDARDLSEGTEDEFTVGQCTPEAILSSRDRIANEKNYSALSSILELCPGLEELSIVAHPLDVSNDAEELASLQETMRDRYMHHLARALPVFQLRKLSLAGLCIDDTDLLTLLRSHISSLLEIDLADITLPEDSFQSVVAYITGGETRFVAIRFDIIREGKCWVNFRCPNDLEGEGLNLLDRGEVRRWGIERKGDVDYLSNERRLLGWSEWWEWTLEKQAREEEEGEGDV
jgi:hypothetical protein